MIFTIQKDLLFKKLTIAQSFTSQQISSAPSLKGVKCIFEKKTLHIYSTNLHDYFNTQIKVQEGEGEFQCIIEAKKILDFLQYVKDDVVKIEKKETVLHIITKTSIGEFLLYKESDYPDWPKCNGKKIEITKKIIELLPLILFSTSKDDSRPVLTSVLFNPKEQESHIVSTDGFRLSMCVFKSKKDISEKIMISGRFLQYILSQLKGDSITFIFSEDGKLVEIQLEDDHFISRVIEGEYPPYEKVIPEKTTTTVRVDREEFINNLKLMSVFAKDKSNIIIFDLSKNQFIIRPKQEVDINTNVKQQYIAFEGEEIQIAFNFQFLIEYLINIKSQVVEMKFATPTSPGIFVIPENPEYIHIIMPLRTQEN